MLRMVFGLSLVAAVAISANARASYEFDTQSLATQTLTSPLFGTDPVVITATGTQHFSLDLGTGAANVTSDFVGTDLPNPLSPGDFLTYSLYNTPASTTGTIVDNGNGTYDVSFTLLFELKITSPGPLDGQTFETHQLATFAALGVPNLPFPSGTVFSAPNPDDTVAIFAQTASPFYSVGDLLGASSARTVTTQGVVPEPSSLAMLGLGVAGMAGFGWRRRQALRA